MLRRPLSLSPILTKGSLSFFLSFFLFLFLSSFLLTHSFLPFLSVTSGSWVGDCFIYTTATNRLNYRVGAESFTIAHLDHPYYLLGYLPATGRVYLADKDVKSLTSYGMSLAVVEYETAVLRGDWETAAEQLLQVPEGEKTRVARFLEGQGHRKLALEVSTDPNHRFDLALHLGLLELAVRVAEDLEKHEEGISLPEASPSSPSSSCPLLSELSGFPTRWRDLGDAALRAWNFPLAEKCLRRAGDLSSLLLLYSASGDKEGMLEVGQAAKVKGRGNIALMALSQAGDLPGVIALLQAQGRWGEAALFSRTYLPSSLPSVVKAWKKAMKRKEEGPSPSQASKDLMEQGDVAEVAKLISHPLEDPELFPDYQDSLKAESLLHSLQAKFPPASKYLQWSELSPMDRDFLSGK